MVPHLIFAATLFVSASAFAKLEIQIEGPSGWASALPTWRVENRWTRWLLGARALTGYHVYAHLCVFILVHLPYAIFVTPPTLQVELRILAFLIFFWILEDFLWFVFNPDYGVRRFNRENAWWHERSWWWIMPREYWIFTPLAGFLYYLGWTIG